MSDGTRFSTRRMTMMAVAAVAAAAALFAVFAATGEPAPPGPGDRTGAAPVRPADPGWRWESYGGVQVQVPDDWPHGGTNTPPCLNAKQDDRPRHGYVGRPGGYVPAIGCTGPSVPPLEERVPYLWFASPAGPGVLEHDGGWVAETRTVGGLALTVFSDDAALRTRVLDSAGPSADGCPAEHAITTDTDTRPDPGPGGLAALGPVESVTLCQYALGDGTRPTASGVLTSSQLSGADARAAVRALLAAPEGDGPNDPGSCVPETAYGDELLLLLVRDSTRTQEVVVRYSGCDGHGIDDGRTHRALTEDALKPLLVGPHQPGHLIGSVADLVWR